MRSITDKLRVLFLADAVFEDIPGGSRLAARELANGLAERGHEVTFLVARQSNDSPNNEVNGSIRIVRYMGAGRALAYLQHGKRACAKLCKETKFDLVHTHFAYASLGPLQAIPKATPRLRTFHGPWDEEASLEDLQMRGALEPIKAELKRNIRHQIEHHSLRLSSKVLTLSNSFARVVQDSFGVDPDKIRTIPGGTDVERFCVPESKDKVRQRLRLPVNRPLLLSVRRLAPRMGLHNLIKAMKTVVEQYPDALLLIGGQGPERSHLLELVQSLGLTFHVKLVGFIPEGDLAAYYQSADLFVLPSTALEGFGLVTTEALACGVPVIGTPVGATPEILTPLDHKLISSDAEASSLAWSICQYLARRQNERLTPKALRNYVVERYTWQRHIDATEAVYADILDTCRRTKSPSVARAADQSSR